MYLREMGAVPLLTREGEVEIAKRIERGQNTMLKALSRSPLVIQKILGMGEEVERGTLAARDLIQISDPLVTDESLEEKKRNFWARSKKSPGSTRKCCRAARSCWPFRAESSPSSIAVCAGNWAG